MEQKFAGETLLYKSLGDSSKSCRHCWLSMKCFRGVETLGPNAERDSSTSRGSVVLDKLGYLSSRKVSNSST